MDALIMSGFMIDHIHFLPTANTDSLRVVEFTAHATETQQLFKPSGIFRKFTGPESDKTRVAIIGRFHGRASSSEAAS